MFTIDYFLLRRVFQPIVDWLSPWCSRFYAARCAGKAGVFCLVFGPLEQAANHEWILLAILLAAYGPLGFQWLRMCGIWSRWDELESRGHHRLPSFSDVYLRIVYICIAMIGVAVALLPPIRIGPFGQPLAFLTYTAAMYLADCNPGTPRPRRVMKWAEA